MLFTLSLTTLLETLKLQKARALFIRVNDGSLILVIRS